MCICSDTKTSKKAPVEVFRAFKGHASLLPPCKIREESQRPQNYFFKKVFTYLKTYVEVLVFQESALFSSLSSSQPQRSCFESQGTRQLQRRCRADTFNKQKQKKQIKK
jgi:hypothetical protein